MRLFDDIRWGLRMLRRRPGLTAVTTATLALGVGANSAVFSVVNGVLLRPLPYAEPERIAALWRTAPETSEEPHSAGDFLDMQRDNRSFERLAGFREIACEMQTPAGDPQHVIGAEVTPDYFDVFGLPAALGRALRGGEDRPGERLVVLREGLWRSAFAADPGIVGRTLRLDGEPFSVVGVMPAAFRWPSDAQLWRLSALPVPSSPVESEGELLSNHGLRYFQVVGRLRAGVTRDAAQAELDAIAARLARAHPDNNANRGLRLVALRDQLVGGVRRTLVLLLAVVGLVLLIAAGNVANLMLAHGVGRARELAVRASLGASPSRVVRQLLVESGVLGVLGGAAGLATAWLLLPLLTRLLPADLPRLDDIAVDPRVVALTLAAALLAGLLAGLAPAWQARRADLVQALHAGPRVSGGAGRRVRQVLVAAELALAVLVLSGAGLLLRSFARLERVDPGFRMQGVTAAALDLPAPRYPARADQVRFYDALLEKLGAGGRLEAAVGFPLPFGDGTASSAPVQVDGRTAPGRDAPRALFATVSPGWFRLLRIPLRRGRVFDASDGRDSPPVVVISESLARREWPGADPLGARLRFGGDQAFTVIGVVADVQRRGPEVAPEPTLYLCHRQFSLPMMHALLRGADTQAAASALRATLRALDPALPLTGVEPLGEALARALAQPRFRAAVLMLFAALALALAAIGLYGVMSDAVQRRRQELGVRLALGARPDGLVRLVLADGLRLALAGGLVGLLAALALGQVLAAFLFGVAPRDPLTLAGVSLLLVGIALVSAWLPARRAARVDPLTALRAE